MINIIQLDEQRPHIVLEGISRTRVLPESLLKDIIAGKANPQLLSKELLQDIINDWMELVKERDNEMES